MRHNDPQCVIGYFLAAWQICRFLKPKQSKGWIFLPNIAQIMHCVSLYNLNMTLCATIMLAALLQESTPAVNNVAYDAKCDGQADPLNLLLNLCRKFCQCE